MRHPNMAAGRGLYAFEEGASYGVDEASLPDLGELWEKGLDWQRLGPLLRRAARVDQMDFEAALDEMLSLCFCDPQRVFKQAYYRKQTKNVRGDDQRPVRGSHSVAQSVEWLYAFDVHCDAFFVYFLVASWATTSCCRRPGPQLRRCSSRTRSTSRRRAPTGT
ncbi:hypothetical protein JL722_6316 [Aureococcus anophagefferens]|nr:hypothetical protein JL722_6316 [Aureococcus anophagefferens]